MMTRKEMLQVRISELHISVNYFTQRLAVYEAELASLEEDEEVPWNQLSQLQARKLPAGPPRPHCRAHLEFRSDCRNCEQEALL